MHGALVEIFASPALAGRRHQMRAFSLRAVGRALVLTSLVVQVSFGAAPSMAASAPMSGESARLALRPPLGGLPLHLPPQADLSITKTGTPDPVTPGADITYTIVMSNAGPDDALIVTFADPIPTGTTFVSLTPIPNNWACNTPPMGMTGNITCTNGTIASGGMATMILVVKVDSGAQPGSTITNTATVSSLTADVNPGNNTATATTGVEPTP
jgi:uncharacterized repeat protein (TIGR01451 family)